MDFQPNRSIHVPLPPDLERNERSHDKLAVQIHIALRSRASQRFRATSSSAAVLRALRLPSGNAVRSGGSLRWLWLLHKCPTIYRCLLHNHTCDNWELVLHTDNAAWLPDVHSGAGNALLRRALPRHCCCTGKSDVEEVLSGFYPPAREDLRRRGNPRGVESDLRSLHKSKAVPETRKRTNAGRSSSADRSKRAGSSGCPRP